MILASLLPIPRLRIPPHGEYSGSPVVARWISRLVTNDICALCLIATLFFLGLPLAPAYATEFRCFQILQNYAAIAASDRVLPTLLNLSLKFKQNKITTQNTETEEDEVSNGADVNMTCRNDGTLEGFDIRFIKEVPLASAKRFFTAILTSMKPEETQASFVDKEIERAIKGGNKRAASDFGVNTAVIFYVDELLHPAMMVDRTE